MDTNRNSTGPEVVARQPDRSECVTYTLPNGLPTLPHYTVKDIYVMPGGMNISLNALLALGARPSTMSLWRRT